MNKVVRYAEVNNHKVHIVEDAVYHNMKSKENASILTVGQFHRDEICFDFISKRIGKRGRLI